MLTIENISVRFDSLLAVDDLSLEMHGGDLLGFLGLIVPHLCRLVFGSDHRRLAVISGFGGATFLVLVATFCHEAGQFINVGIIPLGVVTALCGGPFFIYLLRKRTAGGM